MLDARFNGGGKAADYVIDYLRRPLANYWMTREGQDFTTPVGAIFGPKAMIINMYAGSGGDALPWYFRDAKLGPLVGTRTWGGLVGIYDYPQLMDGGSVTAPRVAFYNRTGDWDVPRWCATGARCLSRWRSHPRIGPMVVIHNWKRPWRW